MKGRVLYVTLPEIVHLQRILQTALFGFEG